MRYICVVGPGAEIAKRFRLERQLGSGGMGSVWAATHLVTQKSVALKFLHEKRDDEAARRRMLREARAACAVQHPNVVAVHDVIEGEDGTPIPGLFAGGSVGQGGLLLEGHGHHLGWAFVSGRIAGRNAAQYPQLDGEEPR